jgi:hypothetical protein
MTKTALIRIIPSIEPINCLVPALRRNHMLARNNSAVPKYSKKPLPTGLIRLSKRNAIIIITAVIGVNLIDLIILFPPPISINIPVAASNI